MSWSSTGRTGTVRIIRAVPVDRDVMSGAEVRPSAGRLLRVAPTGFDRGFRRLGSRLARCRGGARRRPCGH
jgi:hypothetical protein